MKSNQLPKKLNNFINEPNYSAILIDGPWGCGKTFQMETAIKEYNDTSKDIKTKNKIVMISVFGFQSIDEIHTTLYRKFHPGIVKAKKVGAMALSIISKSVELIPAKELFPTELITNALKSAAKTLEKSETPKQEKVTKKDNIIVFDDIERLSGNILYEDFLGYLSNLVQSGIKIICICDSSNINEKDKFNKFKEKLFERTYKINETNEKLINDIFVGYKNSLHLNNIIDQFGNNIRFAWKSFLFFNEIIDYLKNNFLNYEAVYSLDIILCTCIEVIKDIFSIKSENSEFIKIYQYTISELKDSFKDFYLYDDTSKLNSLFQFYQKEKQETYPDIFRKHYFFLSDENKKKYKDDFIKYISNSSTIWDYSTGTLFTNVANSSYEFSDFDLQNIALCISRSKITIDNAFFTREFITYTNPEKINEYKSKIIEIIEDRKFDDYECSMEKASSENDYTYLANILYEIEHNDIDKKDELIQYIIDHQFFFPKIDDDINWAIWTYCTQVAHFFNLSSKYKKTFSEYLDSLINPDFENKSLSDRVETLKAMS